MATYNVNTWPEFVTAYKASGGDSSDPDIIEILSDLDVNDDAPIAMIRAGSNKTINGNYHTIWNLSPAVEFSGEILDRGGGNKIRWNKVNFNNIYRTNTNAVFGATSKSRMEFDMCTFVMKGPRLVDYATLTRCIITHTNAQWRESWANAWLDMCWVHYEPIFANSSPDYKDFQQVTTSYIEGKIAVPGYTSSKYFANIISNSVINIESSINFDRLSSSNPTVKCVYNTTKLTGTIDTAFSNMIGVTDAQMRDAAYLSSIGFAIIT